MTWHRFEARARVEDGMCEERVDGGALQLVTVCLCDGSGEIRDERGEAADARAGPVAPAPQ